MGKLVKLTMHCIMVHMFAAAPILMVLIGYDWMQKGEYVFGAITLAMSVALIGFTVHENWNKLE